MYTHTLIDVSYVYSRTCIGDSNETIDNFDVTAWFGVA